MAQLIEHILEKSFVRCMVLQGYHSARDYPDSIRGILY